MSNEPLEFLIAVTTQYSMRPYISFVRKQPSITDLRGHLQYGPPFIGTLNYRPWGHLQYGPPITGSEIVRHHQDLQNFKYKAMEAEGDHQVHDAYLGSTVSELGAQDQTTADERTAKE